MEYLAIPTVTLEDDQVRLHLTLQDPETAVAVTEFYAEAELSDSLGEATYLATARLVQTVNEYFAPWWTVFGGISSVPRVRPDSLLSAVEFERGRRAFAAGEYADAVRAFEGFVAADSEFALGHAWLGRSYERLGHLDDGVTHLESAGGLLTDDAPAVDSLLIEASLALARRDSPALENAYLEWIRRYPDDLAAYAELADVYYAQRRYEDGVTLAHQALERDENFLAAHVALTKLYTNLDNYAFSDRHVARALSLADELDDGAGRAQALLASVDSLRDRGRAVDALERAREALERFEALDFDVGIGRARKYVGDSLFSQSALPESLDAYRLALGDDDIPNLALRAILYTNIGSLEFTLGAYEQALDGWRRGLAAAEALQDRERQATALLNLGSVQVDFGPDPMQGLRDAQRALAIVEQQGNGRDEVFARQIVASYHSRAGEAETARRELQRALDVASRLEQAQVANVQFGFVGAHFRQDQYRVARERAELAIDGFMTAENGRDLAWAEILKARILSRIGRQDEASTLLERVQQTVADEGFADLQPELQLALGEVSYEMHHVAEAADHFLAAADVWTRAGQADPASVEALAFRGFVLAEQGSDAEGVATLRETLAYVERMGWKPLEARMRNQLAQVELERGDAAEALAVLSALMLDEGATIGLEAKGLREHWLRRARATLGDVSEAASHAENATALAAQLQASLAPEDWETYNRRRSMAALLRAER